MGINSKICLIGNSIGFLNIYYLLKVPAIWIRHVPRDLYEVATNADPDQTAPSWGLADLDLHYLPMPDIPMLSILTLSLTTCHFLHMPYADTVVPDQPANLRSLT